MTIDAKLILFGDILTVTATILAIILAVVAARSYRAHTAVSRERTAIFSLRSRSR